MRRVFTTLAIMLAAPVGAQQRPDGWSVGAFASVDQSIYVGEDTSLTLLPGLSYKSGDWSYGLNGISGKIHEDGPSSLMVQLKPRFFGLITSDAPELDGIDRNVTADIGGSWSYAFSPKTSLELSALQEVTGAHNGQELEIGIEQQVNLGPVPVWLSGTLTWQSDDLTHYLYGVKPSEATATRAAYAPGSALIPSVAVTTGYPLSARALLFGSISYTVLPDEVSSSPIVARDDRLRFSTGINFSF